MWFFKMLLLLALIASWIPSVKSQDFANTPLYSTEQEEGGTQEEEDNEELAA